MGPCGLVTTIRSSLAVRFRTNGASQENGVRADMAPPFSRWLVGRAELMGPDDAPCAFLPEGLGQILLPNAGQAILPS